MLFLYGNPKQFKHITDYKYSTNTKYGFLIYYKLPATLKGHCTQIFTSGFYYEKC